MVHPPMSTGVVHHRRCGDETTTNDGLYTLRSKQVFSSAWFWSLERAFVGLYVGAPHIRNAAAGRIQDLEVST